MPHRHTHRGAFSPSEVPPRLLDTLVAEAAAEGCELVVLTSREPVERLAQLTRSAAADQLADASVQRELERWVQPSGSQARDGVPARARLAPAQAGDAAARLAWLPGGAVAAAQLRAAGNRPGRR